MKMKKKKMADNNNLENELEQDVAPTNNTYNDQTSNDNNTSYDDQNNNQNGSGISVKISNKQDNDVVRRTHQRKITWWFVYSTTLLVVVGILLIVFVKMQDSQLNALTNLLTTYSYISAAVVMTFMGAEAFNFYQKK